MTITQIIALLLAGPVAIIMFGKCFIALSPSSPYNFRMSQAFYLCVAVVVLLVAFLGVQ